MSAILQRDVRDVAGISDVAAMRRLLGVVAARSASLVNYSELASIAGIPKTTLLRYFAVLEQICLVWTLPAWSGDPARRLTKLPKVFMDDSSLAASLQYIDAQRLLDDRTAFGHMLELFVANELRRHCSWTSQSTQLYHYRTSDGAEVDFILERQSGRRVAIEVKASATLGKNDFRSILRLIDDPKMQIDAAYIFYTGTTVVPVQKNVYALPLSILWTSSKVR